MKISSFTTPNGKGQIVIPKEIRDALHIDSHVTLNITLAGKGIYIYPVEEFLTRVEGESSYLKLLEKTKGGWKNDNWDTIKRKRSQIEHKASRLRKKVW